MGNEDLLGLADDREDMALHPSDSTEGGLLAEVERVLSQARAQNPHGDNSDEAGVWNDGFCVAWATVRAALATRTPAPSLGEDVVETELAFFGKAEKLAIAEWNRIRPTGGRFWSELDPQMKELAEWCVRAGYRKALSSMRPVQEEGVGEDVPRLNIRCEMQGESLGATTQLNVVRVEREDDGSFTAVTDFWQAHPEASPPSLGVEELRELSEKATPGPWTDAADVSCRTLIRQGDERTGKRLASTFIRHAASAPEANLKAIRENEANAAFIVACVNHVRAALSRVSGGV